MNSPEEQDRLAATLADWRLKPGRDPQFRARVWARIAAAKNPASWLHYVQAHPRTVAGALALALVAGAFVGREQARARAEADSGRLAAIYVSALDARAMTMP